MHNAHIELYLTSDFTNIFPLVTNVLRDVMVDREAHSGKWYFLQDAADGFITSRANCVASLMREL